MEMLVAVLQILCSLSYLGPRVEIVTKSREAIYFREFRHVKSFNLLPAPGGIVITCVSLLVSLFVRLFFRSLVGSLYSLLFLE